MSFKSLTVLLAYTVLSFVPGLVFAIPHGHLSVTNYHEIGLTAATCYCVSLFCLAILHIGTPYFTPWRDELLYLPMSTLGLVILYFIWPSFITLSQDMLAQLRWDKLPDFSEAQRTFTIFFGIIVICTCFAIGRTLRMLIDPPKLEQKRLKDREGHRAETNIFGSASLGKWRDIAARVNRRENALGTQIVLGEDYDPRKNKSYSHDDRTTWGEGGKASIISMDTGFSNGHSLIITGSSGGKTSAFTIPNCLAYRQKLIIVDPEGEALSHTRNARERMGRKIIEINLSSHFDLMLFMKPHLTNSTAFRQLADNMLVRERDSEFSKFYSEGAIQFLAGLLEFYTNETTSNPLVALAELMGFGETKMLKLCENIVKVSKSGNVRRSISTVVNKGDRYLNFLMGTITQSLNWMMADDVLATVTNENAHGLAMDAPETDIFVTFRSEQMRQYPGLIRLILGSFTYYKMNTAKDNIPALMIVDEAHLFGYFQLFEVLRDRARKHRLHLMLIFQGMGQIIDNYGRSGASDWKSVAMRSYSRIEDEQECEMISRMIGTFTASISDTSKNQSNRAGSLGPQNVSHGTSERLHKAQVITPDELRVLPMDAQVLFLQGERPMICGKAFYFRRNDQFRNISPIPPKKTPVYRRALKALRITQIRSSRA